MNKNEPHKLIYWATAGCASRTISGVISRICGELLIWRGGTWISGGAPTHQQGLPEKTDDSWDIICATRNPYTRCISSWLDVNLEDPTLTLEKYLKESRYKNFDDGHPADNFYWLEWPIIGRNPDYLVRLEHMGEDLMKIPKLFNNYSEKEWEHDIKECINENSHKGENPNDKYNDKGHQITNIHYTQELADIVYEKEKFIFNYVGYSKDSWK